MGKITLIYNNLNPEGGGVPRYSYEILKGLKKKIKVEEINFSPVYGESTLEKLKNILFNRKGFLKSKKDKISPINHFVIPDIFYNVGEGKKIVTMHDLMMFDVFGVHTFYGFGKRLLLSGRYRSALKHSNHFISVSTQTKKELMDKGVSEEKITVVNHGINQKFKYKKVWDKRDKKIGYLSPFHQRKRPEKLLRDWIGSKIENYSLILGGSGGPKEKELKERFKSKESITFLGRIPEEELVDFYNSFKAFVFPSQYEGFGFPPLEAVACGTPAFIYEDARITPEVRKFCYTIKSVEEVPKILGKIKKSEIKRKAEEVKKEFSWEKTVKETLNVYRKVNDKKDIL